MAEFFDIDMNKVEDERRRMLEGCRRQNAITEGKVKKGGVNKAPLGPRPPPPKGQGGSR